MERIKIKHESRPERCEICHQSDLFDPTSGQCSRCSNLAPTNINYQPAFQQFNTKYYGFNNTNTGIWRDNSTLIMHKNAVLPDRCVKCNAPALGRRLRKKVSWYHPAYFLLLLVNLIVFLVVAALIRKTAHIEIGLCEQHFEKRKRDQGISWFFAAVGIISFFGAIGSGSGFATFMGIFFIIAAVIYGLITVPLVKPTKMDDNYIWLKGVDRDMVNDYPQVPR